MSMFVIIAGLVLVQIVPYGFIIAAIGLGLFGVGTLFSFITLPVEYNASNRALAWLQRKNMVSREELAGAQDAAITSYGLLLIAWWSGLGDFSMSTWLCSFK